MKRIFGMQTNIEVFYKLILSFWVCLARLAQSIQNKKFAYLCSISKKTLAFCQLINKIFYEVIISLWVCKTRHPLNTQNKFPISF